MPLASVQLICPVLSVTEPVPVPISETETKKVGTMEAKLTCSVWLPLIVTLHVAVPEHVLQPLKLVPALGVAVRITTDPLS